jgi:capsular exopolysaccharide synthesis family protein
MPFLAVLPAVSGRVQSEHQSLAASSAPSLLAHGEDGPLARMLWSEPHSEQADAIRSLRAAVLLSTPSGAAPQVILVSSANAGEGKTTVALNLAGVLAQQGRTCLIEADLRSPAIESALGLNPTVGLAEVLQGQAELNDALIPAGNIAGLTVLPVKSIPENPADLLASEHMHATLTNLRKLFRYVVIDSPPLIPFSDGRSLAQFSDAVVLVSRYGSTTRRSITRGAELLFEAQAPMVGVVLNDMDFSSADYHYFNYGYSAHLRNHKYDYAKRKPAPPVQPKSDGPPPEMSRGAHA